MPKCPSKVTKAWRDGLSASLKKYYRDGGKHGMRGRKHSNETKRKMSLAQKDRFKNQAERDKIATKLTSPDTPTKERDRKSQRAFKWRNDVFVRDDYTCRKCGTRGDTMNAHHVFNFADYPKLRFEVSNGATLCERCHKRFHELYGTKHNTFAQLYEFIEEDIV